MIVEAWIDDLQIHYDPPQLGPIALRQLDAFGTPEPRNNRPTRSRRHGGIELTRYFEPRVIDLEGYVQGDGQDDMWDLLQDLDWKLALNGLDHTLKFKRGGRDFYEQCLVQVSGKMDMPLRVWGDTLPWSVQLTAADPRLYSDTLHSQSFSVSATVTNAGNFVTPPIITFTGPASDPGLTNDTLNVENTILLQGDFASGDTLVVDCGERTVLLNGASRPDLLHIGATDFWSLNAGDNDLSRIGSAASTEVEWRDARIG